MGVELTDTHNMTEYDTNNIFAKIIRGEIPSYKIFETDKVLAILDAFPCAEGHSLLLPKTSNVHNAIDMTPEESAALFQEIPRLCKVVKKATGCDSVNILMNCGAEAGQMVFHPHVHVIPRNKDDELIKHPGPFNGMVDKDAALALLEKMQDKQE